MVKKKIRLGRGLGALLEDVKTTTQPFEKQPTSTGDHSPLTRQTADQESGLHELPIEQLEKGKYQPRMHLDKNALAELGESIKSQGILQPLLVRKLAPARYEIIAGERRWRGAQIAGLKTVPAVIRNIHDKTAMAIALIENIQRENLNAIEEAKGYKRLLDEFGLTHQEVSEAVGCSRAQVTNLIRLLSLHPQIQSMLGHAELDMGHARALLALPGNDQPKAALLITRKCLSVRQAEALVKKLNSPDRATNSASNSTADTERLEEDLSNRIGARVNIQHGPRKGRLVIHYHSLDELDGILKRIK